MSHVQSSPPAPYDVDSASDEAIIARALAILAKRVKTMPAMTSPANVKAFLELHAGARADQHREVFVVLYLDSQHHVISVDDVCHGTLGQCSVYPREIVRGALRHGAAAVILSHNHPSGSPEPSRADVALTKAVRDALQLIDVSVLDHIVTAGAQSVSMAERGDI